MKKCKDCNKLIGGNKRRTVCDVCYRERSRKSRKENWRKNHGKASKKLKTFQEYYEEEYKTCKKATPTWDNAVQIMLNDHAKLLSHLEARVLELEGEIANLTE